VERGVDGDCIVHRGEEAEMVSLRYADEFEAWKVRPHAYGTVGAIEVAMHKTQMV
jgi:hypothetical protein